MSEDRTSYTVAGRVPAEVNGDRPANELSKREWLAGQALVGLVSRATGVDHAAWAVRLADQVLAKLEEEG